MLCRTTYIQASNDPDHFCGTYIRHELRDCCNYRWASKYILLAPVSATRFEARNKLSNVPASVHQPSISSHVIASRSMYALLTSVISSSPRPEGFRDRMMS